MTDIDNIPNETPASEQPELSNIEAQNQNTPEITEDEMPAPTKPETSVSPAPHKKRRTLRLFITSFCITLLTLGALFALGVFIVARTVVPPEIPSIERPSVMPPRRPLPPHDNTGSTNTNNGDEYNPDEFLGYGLSAPERFTNDDRRDMFYTFLIIGLNEGTNANTIMVASYDAITREAHLISIPRDSLMNVNRRGRKLSSAYMVGALGGRGRTGGVAQMQREVMTVIGFIPDFYVVIDYDAFFSIIDAVGGIEVYVPMRMRYTDPGQNLNIDIQPGLQHMDAQTALNFSRFRQGDPGFPSPPRGDYFRIESQQAVISAVISQLLRPANILNIPEFANIFNESVYTNLTIGNMLWFGAHLNHIRGTDALTSHTTPMLGTSGYPMWYEILNAPEIVSLVNRTINPFYHNIELGDLNIITQ